jgi:hypothetical protein
MAAGRFTKGASCSASITCVMFSIRYRLHLTSGIVKTPRPHPHPFFNFAVELCRISHITGSKSRRPGWSGWIPPDVSTFLGCASSKVSYSEETIVANSRSRAARDTLKKIFRHEQHLRCFTNHTNMNTYTIKK